MTKRKSIQVYRNEQEEKEVELVAKALGCKTISGAYKKAVSLLYNLKNTII